MSVEPTPADIADRYADARSRVVELIAGASPQDLATPVPATPRWTVHELLSHMVGCPADLADGKFDGAGSEDWTQAQVDARAHATLEQLLAEWNDIAPRVDAAVREGLVPAPVSFDVLTHESDLRGALGLVSTPDPLALRFLTDGFGSRAVSVAAKAGATPLQLRASDTDWTIGEPGGVTAVAPEREWARAMTGRRSNAQVSAYDWSGDPTPYLDLLSPFGPLCATDCTA